MRVVVLGGMEAGVCRGEGFQRPEDGVLLVRGEGPGELSHVRQPRGLDLVDHVASVRGRLSEDYTPGLGVVNPLDDPALLHPADDPGRAGDGDAEVDGGATG